MAEVKLTKNELRTQQNKLSQLQKYLPTLQLKKAMLQAEVNEARIEIAQCEKEYKKATIGSSPMLPFWQKKPLSNLQMSSRLLRCASAMKI